MNGHTIVTVRGGKSCTNPSGIVFLFLRTFWILHCRLVVDLSRLNWSKCLNWFCNIIEFTSIILVAMFVLWKSIWALNIKLLNVWTSIVNVVFSLFSVFQIMSYGGFLRFTVETEGGTTLLPGGVLASYPLIQIQGNDKLVLEYFPVVETQGRNVKTNQVMTSLLFYIYLLHLEDSQKILTIVEWAKNSKHQQTRI